MTDKFYVKFAWAVDWAVYAHGLRHPVESREHGQRLLTRWNGVGSLRENDRRAKICYRAKCEADMTAARGEDAE